MIASEVAMRRFDPIGSVDIGARTSGPARGFRLGAPIRIQVYIMRLIGHLKSAGKVGGVVDIGAWGPFCM
jgi:hypothetical protein